MRSEARAIWRPCQRQGPKNACVSGEGLSSRGRIRVGQAQTGAFSLSCLRVEGRARLVIARRPEADAAIHTPILRRWRYGLLWPRHPRPQKLTKSFHPGASRPRATRRSNRWPRSSISSEPTTAALKRWCLRVIAPSFKSSFPTRSWSSWCARNPASTTTRRPARARRAHPAAALRLDRPGGARRAVAGHDPRADGRRTLRESQRGWCG